MKEMNKHMLLVMKWLNDKSSVTEAELYENRKAAIDAVNAVNAVDSSYASYIAYAAAVNAIRGAAVGAECWVNKYFDRSGEDKSLYDAALLLAEQQVEVYQAVAGARG